MQCYMYICLSVCGTLVQVSQEKQQWKKREQFHFDEKKERSDSCQSPSTLTIIISPLHLSTLHPTSQHHCSPSPLHLSPCHHPPSHCTATLSRKTLNPSTNVHICNELYLTFLLQFGKGGIWVNLCIKWWLLVCEEGRVLYDVRMFIVYDF